MYHVRAAPAPLLSQPDMPREPVTSEPGIQEIARVSAAANPVELGRATDRLIHGGRRSGKIAASSAGRSPHPYEQAAARSSDQLLDPGVVIETSELRWFADGVPPDEVVSWFTDHGRRGDVEVRRDLYLVDGRIDVGVKRRGGDTLELKVRRSVADGRASAAGPVGRIEVWHKWSPADALVDEPSDQPWVEVGKLIVRRRFTVDGDDVVLTDGRRSMAGAGCDAEVTAIELGQAAAWSFAFAAFGPLAVRLTSIAAAWGALAAGGAPLDSSLTGLVVSCGYPQWLACRIGSTQIVGEGPDSVT